MTDAELDARVTALSSDDLREIVADTSDLPWYRSHALRVALAREVLKLRALVDGLAARCVGQSELLSQRAEKTKVEEIFQGG